MKKKAFIALFIIASFAIMSAYNANTINAVQEPIANLVFKTNSGNPVRGDYGLFIAQYLRDIGIELEVKLEEWSVFVGELTLSHDYDCGIVGISGGAISPDFRSAYSENGTLNLFGLDADMPYQQESEDLQLEATTITDLTAQQQMYYEWQQLVMDKIVPICPLFTRRSYRAMWSNTLGYDYDWGWYASSVDMEFDGLHDGQVSIDEWNIADAMWTTLNPLFNRDTSSSNLFRLYLRPGLSVNPEMIPIKNGLIVDWEMINANHYVYTVRDNVYFNPSFDVVGRDASSDALDATDLTQLEVGMKGEYSNGENQKMTAKDFVFTYGAWATVSARTYNWYWLENCYVDPSDEMKFHVHIDGDYTTEELEENVFFYEQIVYSEILPEFFLNSTDTTFTETTLGDWTVTGLYQNGTHDITTEAPWTFFGASSFGTGQYMLDYYVPHSVTVLQASPYWHGVGLIDGLSGKTQMVDTYNIRVIPDSTAELAEFKAGKLDTVGVTSFPTERKQMQADPRFTVYSLMPAAYDFFFYNLQRPFIGGEDNYEYLTDVPGKEDYTKGVAVRKAMNYAIDRNEINEVMLEGEAVICHSVTYPYHAFYYNNEIIKYDYNLEAAQEWLAAAGYTITIDVPIPIIGIIAAIGAAAFIVFYRKRK